MAARAQNVSNTHRQTQELHAQQPSYTQVVLKPDRHLGTIVIILKNSNQNW